MRASAAQSDFGIPAKGHCESPAEGVCFSRKAAAKYFFKILVKALSNVTRSIERTECGLKINQRKSKPAQDVKVAGWW